MLARLVCQTGIETSKTNHCAVALVVRLAQCKVLLIAWKQIGPCYTNNSKCIGRQTESSQLLINFTSQQLSNIRKHMTIMQPRLTSSEMALSNYCTISGWQDQTSQMRVILITS